MRACVIVAIAIAGCGGESDDLTVRIDTGTLHGVYQGDARTFLGVPYAAPPTGANRFRPPQPALPLDGVFPAVQLGIQCPQTFSLAGPGGDEDCLFLNVWAPKGSGKKPVMVWLHGGGFIFGSGSENYYNGEHLAETFGIVVVTLNYRLGAFGFYGGAEFAAEGPEYPSAGNYGLDDQRAALQWVQRNIAAFGGDPDRVLLYGESAGGYSVCAHYVSPRSAGLFAWAISESGLCTSSVLEPTPAQAATAATALAQKLGCTGAPEAMRTCMRAATTQQILDATKLPPADQQLPGGPFYSELASQQMFPHPDNFVLAKSLREMFASGSFTKVPLLLGSNRDEGTLFQTSLFAVSVANEADYRAALARRFGAAMVDAIVTRYPVATFGTANKALAQVSGDAFFVCPARRVARAVAAAGVPVYRYTFQQTIEAPFAPDLGTFHSSELPFVFGNDTFPLGRVGASGAALAAQIQGYWTRFAATGDPNGGDAPAWPAFDANERHLVLATPIVAGDHLDAQVCDFWDTLPN